MTAVTLLLQLGISRLQSNSTLVPGGGKKGWIVETVDGKRKILKEMVKLIVENLRTFSL